MLSGWFGCAAAARTVVAATVPAADRHAAAFGAAFALALFVFVSFGGLAWTWRSGRLGAVRRGGALEAPRAGRGGAAGVAPRPVVVPSGVDTDQLLAAARTRFLRLQAAWDAHDLQALGHLTTPDMLEELKQVLGARVDAHSRTDVLSLHAELVGLEEVDAAWLAAVEFSGVIRESSEAGAQPFRELWMLAASNDAKDGSSWRLARQQALF